MGNLKPLPTLQNHKPWNTKNTNGMLHCRKFPTAIALTSDNTSEGN
jgi:hypothetical protein